MTAEDPPCDLSVVLPCLDEEQTIAICVEKARAALDRLGIAGEVLVVDNGSTDRSVELAEAKGARVVRCPVRGYGAALQFGFRAARGRWLLMADADDSYDLGELGAFAEQLRAGHPFVMGTRLRGRVEPGAMPLLNRYLGTPVLTAILNWLFSMRISDCNCGMRAIDRQRYLGLGVTSPGMEFASEMIVKAAIHQIPITEVPITLHKDKRGRPPHLRPWRDGWRHLRLLLWHAPDHTMTVPGLVLFLLGLLLVIPQLFGPFSIGSVRFDFHYMILGMTIAMLGLPPLSLGIAIHAVLPERRLRRAAFLGRVEQWFSFDLAVALAALLLIAGVSCDVAVLVHWLATDRGALTAGYTRLSLGGALLTATGFQIMLLALWVGSARSALARSPVDELLGTRAEDRRKKDGVRA